jgi:hypothetical protein
MFSLIFSQALLMSKLSLKLSKAANVFEISTWYFSLTSISSRFLRSNLSKSNFCLVCLLTEIHLQLLLYFQNKFNLHIASENRSFLGGGGGH